MSEERTQYETGDVVDASELPAMLKRGSKYHAVKTWSELCQREFDSKAEAIRGEELWLMQEASEIGHLVFQPEPFVLSMKPKITYQPDYSYEVDGHVCYEDCKGLITRELRVKVVWLFEKYKHRIMITTKTKDGWKAKYLV